MEEIERIRVSIKGLIDSFPRSELVWRDRLVDLATIKARIATLEAENAHLIGELAVKEMALRNVVFKGMDCSACDRVKTCEGVENTYDGVAKCAEAALAKAREEKEKS